MQYRLSPSIPGIEVVNHIKYLSLALSHNLSFELRVFLLLKLCSHRTYILRILRSQGLNANQLKLLFVLWLFCLFHMHYLLGMFLSAGHAINAFLKHAYKCGFCSNLITVKHLFCSSVTILCNRMQNSWHCLHILLPCIKTSNMLSGAVVLQTIFCYNINIIWFRLLTGAFSDIMP